jgi:predicted SAM-dependent methyltransferase
MKVELASGERPREGYLHCDMRRLESTDLACRVESLPFAGGSVEDLLASHIIEHFPYARVGEVLAEWRRVLSPGGTLRIITPNLGYIAHGYVEGWLEHAEARNRLYGGQDYEGNYHFNMFDSPSLALALREAGFRNIHDVTASYERRKVPMSIYLNAEK